jgi:hypothetical protein
MTKRKPTDLVLDAKNETTELAVAKSKGETAKWRAKYNSAVSETAELAGQLDAFLGIQGPVKKKKFERRSASRGHGVAVIAPATDWHVEERVFLERTNGKNEFCIAEARRRIQQYYQKVLRLIQHQNKLSSVVELWHPLLGDLLSGYIHEELLETNELSPTEACVFLQEMISAGIDLWLENTNLPIYIPTCVGNHSRTTPKKRIKTSCKNSFEWLLYKTMAARYEDNPRVTWMVGEGYHNIQEIQGRQVRFHHGDGLRYQGGVGGITIPVNKSIAAWNQSDHVDLDVFGHWHTALWNYPDWISCGCLIGFTEYAVEIKAKFQHPTQMFIVIDRDYGVTSAVPIFLTEPARRKK